MQVSSTCKLRTRHTHITCHQLPFNYRCLVYPCTMVWPHCMEQAQPHSLRYYYIYKTLSPTPQHLHMQCIQSHFYSPSGMTSQTLICYRSRLFGTVLFVFLSQTANLWREIHFQRVSLNWVLISYDSFRLSIPADTPPHVRVVGWGFYVGTINAPTGSCYRQLSDKIMTI